MRKPIINLEELIQKTNERSLLIEQQQGRSRTKKSLKKYLTETDYNSVRNHLEEVKEKK